jgi:hypothetical protein
MSFFLRYWIDRIRIIVRKQAIAKCKVLGKNAWLSHINILLEMLNIQALQEMHVKRKRKKNISDI